MRRIIKWSFIVLFYFLSALDIYFIFKILVDPQWKYVLNILLLVPIVLIFLKSLEGLFKNSKFYFTLLQPKDGKKIVHESGEYYIKYDKKTGFYILYKDYIIFRKNLEKYNSEYVPGIKDITDKVKRSLEELYREKTKHVRRKDILNTWDGYTSDQVKRDDKIKQIV